MGVRDPFLHRLPPVVAEMMRKPYPELADTVERVGGVIKREEESFLATIDGGLERIEKLFAAIGRSGGAVVAGGDAAELYTTYGFPPELLETLAAERNCGFDWDGFRAAMEEHGVKSGAGSRVEVFTSGPLDALKKTMHGSDFLGYDATDAAGKVVGIIAQDALCDRLEEVGHAATVTVVLDRTPFYGESGGQVGDTGRLAWPGGEFDVIDTQREGGFILHVGHLRRGVIELGHTVTATVDETRRAALRRAHSATHLLHAALQHHLGSHAVQQGSKVDADLLRFDFSHPSSIDRDTLRAIESTVNVGVLAAVPVSARLLPLAEARHAGAMMLFGEKYPDVVRMVTMEGVSRELCGGTHVASTGQIGLVRIVGEESVSAGTRRITAVTGARALDRFRQAEDALAEAAGTLKVPVGELPHRLGAVLKELRDLKKAKPAAAAAGTSPEELLAGAIDVGGTRVVVAEAKGSDAGAMRQCIDQLRRKASPIAVLLGAVEADKVTLVAGISRELEARGLSAGTWIRDAATIVGGKGGGRPDLAQAGGKLVDQLPAALAAARKSIETLLRA
jgi:alanyl-tRNA synthetase